MGTAVAAIVVAVGVPSAAEAVTIAPPWCGTPEPDATAALPDGTGANDPVGSFPHIPYYAIGCTLQKIKAEGVRGRMTIEQHGVSAQGRPMWRVTINALETSAQRRAYDNWWDVRRLAREDPSRAQRELRHARGAVKVPLYIQSGIHGNESEGVDAMMEFINRLATSRRGQDAEVDRWLDHSILVFNVVHNPDGRALGQRANGNGFDLNRDFLTQSQTETKASVATMQKWLFPDMLDQHGYVTPTLIEATTKPHGPGIDYDLFLKWNQPRTKANGDALATVGLGYQRPINDWCADADLPPFGQTRCADGSLPGPAVAEGWDDWGPFYTPMYNQLVGLNGSTIEMCQSTAPASTTQYTCGAPGATNFPRGRIAAKIAQALVTTSTVEFNVANRSAVLNDMLEIYRRGKAGAPRPPCCPAPFDRENNWMYEYPEAYMIPVGQGQRSDAEANRLVDWLLTNGIEVHKLLLPARIGGTWYQHGSYVVSLRQPHRGLVEESLGAGVDISSRIGQLYAPPAAFSHGLLWGADVVQVPRGTPIWALALPIDRTPKLRGGVEHSHRATAYALELDSPTAVRTLNALLRAGVTAQIAEAPFGRYPAGTALFDRGARRALERAADDSGLIFRAVDGPLPAATPLTRVPRIAVLTGGLTQEIWVMRQLGFEADPVSTAATGALNNANGPNPLDAYDVVFNQAGWPGAAAQATARARLSAFFAAGGGYLGAGVNGTAFLASAGEVAGLSAAARSGAGRSGIVRWNNTGGASSPITGAYPAQDTAIMDPPTWLTAVPPTLSVDARLPSSNFFVSGLWLLDEQSSTAPGAALIAHGPNAANTNRLTVFAMNPLYRADPEREWPAFASAAYWVGKRAGAPALAPVQQTAAMEEVVEVPSSRHGH
ncbi:M14 family zinc carboxypeptidase [Solirubrobacter deserti]|uniref:M14 family zinc carboxypeptidase n=1 Tax=Solirubrobacter deserti TaxID=2282478 RepID=A0ABT4RRF3_9ACTN|nr:M14 family zinc carboxypeptidase [Solirubrobacter deserti]MDA0140830.1 M14 family zinc carboxypeptidase [Solirubrobacter deserti]